VRIEVTIGFNGPDAEAIKRAALGAGMTPAELVFATVQSRYGLRKTAVDKVDTIGPRLVQAHAAGMADQQIADLIGVHVSTITQRRKALGLAVNYRRVRKDQA
jgi:hypothetical protein